MKEMIDKSEVVAEIEKRKHKMLDTIIYERDKECVVRTVYQLNRIILFLDTLETKEVDLKEEEKLNKAIKLADAMYNAAQQLTTDASKLHKAMQDWWNFKNIEL